MPKPAYSRLPTGSTAQAVWGGAITPAGMAHASSAPVVVLTRATDCRDTPSICVKMPPMNIVVPSDANAIERTVSLADGSHVGSSAPVAGSRADEMSHAQRRRPS